MLDRVGRNVVVVEVVVESVEGDLALHEVDDHDGQESHRHADRVDVGQAHEGFVRRQDLQGNILVLAGCLLFSENGFVQSNTASSLAILMAKVFHSCHPSPNASV